MAISFVVAASADANTVSLPAGWQVGDVAIVHAVRIPSASTPSLPAGWTSIANNPGTNVSRRVGYRLLQSGDTSIGTWTNATQVLVGIYRGVDQTTPIGASAGGPTTAVTVITLSSLTLQVADGTSWVIGAYAHDNATNTKSSAFTALANRSSGLTSVKMGLSDSEGGVTSWSSKTSTTTLDASGERTQRSVELRAGASGPQSVTIGSITQAATGPAPARCNLSVRV